MAPVQWQLKSHSSFCSPKVSNSKERHKEAKKEAQRAVAKARSEATEEWYQALDSKEGEKTIH